MTPRPCVREQDVQRAGASGRWTAELRRHVSECAICGDVSLIAGALAAAPQVHKRVTANPALLWERARLARRQRAEIQIQRIVTATRIAAVAVGGAAVAALIVSLAVWPASWPSLWSALTPADDDRALIYGAGALVMAAAFGLSRLMSDDHRPTSRRT